MAQEYYRDIVLTPGPFQHYRIDAADRLGRLGDLATTQQYYASAQQYYRQLYKEDVQNCSFALAGRIAIVVLWHDMEIKKRRGNITKSVLRGVSVSTGEQRSLVHKA